MLYLVCWGIEVEIFIWVIVLVDLLVVWVVFGVLVCNVVVGFFEGLDKYDLFI